MSEYNERVATVTNDLILTIRDSLTKHKVTLREYQSAMQWLRQLVDAHEVPMFADNFFERTVERATHDGLPGSEPTVQGPYYRPGAPLLTEKPFILPMRDQEPGTPTVFTGKVVDLDGKPIAGALIDVWHAGNDGTYSGFVGDAPPFNLRAKLYADENGAFQFRSIRPSPYQIPTGGPTGRYLEMINRHAWRPAHFHFKVSAPGFVEITTQTYFEGDPWLEGDGDVSGGVKDSLIIELVQSDDADVAKRYGLETPFTAGSYTFRLRPAE
jgi:catechol 1,2-dioxygenase